MNRTDIIIDKLLVVSIITPFYEPVKYSSINISYKRVLYYRFYILVIYCFIIIISVYNKSTYLNLLIYKILRFYFLYKSYLKVVKV